MSGHNYIAIVDQLSADTGAQDCGFGYSRQQISAAIQELFKMSSRNTSSDNQALLQTELTKADRVQRLLLYLHSQAVNAVSPRAKRQAIDAVSLVIEMLGPRVGDADILPHVVHLLLSSIEKLPTQVVCRFVCVCTLALPVVCDCQVAGCEHLLQLCKSASKAAVLAVQVHPIVAVVTPVAEHWPHKDRNFALDVLSTLVSRSAERSLYDELTKLDAFPHGEKFAQLNLKLQSWRKDWPLSADLLRFVDTGAMPSIHQMH